MYDISVKLAAIYNFQNKISGHVRLEVMTLDELFNIVRPTDAFSAEKILDAATKVHAESTCNSPSF